MIQKQWQATRRPGKTTSANVVNSGANVVSSGANVVNSGANENLVVVHVKIKYEETLTLLSCVKQMHI